MSEQKYKEIEKIYRNKIKIAFFYAIKSYKFAKIGGTTEFKAISS